MRRKIDEINKGLHNVEKMLQQKSKNIEKAQEIQKVISVLSFPSAFSIPPVPQSSGCALWMNLKHRDAHPEPVGPPYCMSPAEG